MCKWQKLLVFAMQDAFRQHLQGSWNAHPKNIAAKYNKLIIGDLTKTGKPDIAFFYTNIDTIAITEGCIVLK